MMSHSASRSTQQRHGGLILAPRLAGRRPVRAHTYAAAQTKPAGLVSFENANFPMDQDKRTYHVGTKRGEVANRILSVGDVTRAALCASFMEPPPGMSEVYSYKSKRGFVTHTGLFDGVPISVVSTGMGYPNMDFVVRECRAVTDGELAFVRVGTCGAIQAPPGKLGSVVVASKGSVLVRRNPDAYDDPTVGKYFVSKPALPDAKLSALLESEMRSALNGDESEVVSAMNASADSFYSSQGRTGDDFDDANENLLDEIILKRQPEVVSLEMETFHLLDLARNSRELSVHAASCAIVLAERRSNDFLPADRIEFMERTCCRAALSTLAKASVRDVDGKEAYGDACVWA